MSFPKRRRFRLLALLLAGTVLALAIACGGTETVVETVVVPQTVIVEKQVPVEKVVKETVIVEKKIVETVVTVATPTPGAAAAAPPAGEVTIAVAEVPPLIQDPRRDIRASGGIGKDFSVYETIVRAPHVAPPNPPPMQNYSPDDLGIAKSWEVAPDGTSITFKIRENIPWHKNGGDWGFVDEEDVAWTFNQAFAADSVNNGAEEIGPEMKLGFDIVGPMTVKQNIEPGGFDPTWAWLEGNAGFNGIVIVNKEAFDKLGEEGYAETPIGTGKYRALEWVADDKVVLEALPEHWTGIVPHVKTVTIVHMPEAATREAALRAGEVDIGELSPQVITDTVKAIGGRVQEIGIARPQGFQMAGNYWSTKCPGCEGGVMPRPGFKPDAKHPWIGDPADADSMERARKVRWALAMTIDQKSIIKNVLEGFGRVIYAWENILPDDPLHKDEWIIPYDPDKARQYMADAGYPDGFDMEIWVPSTFPPGTIAAAEAVAEMWRQQLKINVTIDRTAYAVRRPQTVEKTINVPFTHGINWIPGATSARYICPHPGHIVGFTMPDDECAIGLSNATEPSLDKRIQNNIKNQDYLSHEMLFVPMFQAPAVLFAVGPRIAEWDPYNSQDVLPNRPESIVLK